MRKWIGTIAVGLLCVAVGMIAVGSVLEHDRYTNVGVGVVVAALLILLGTLARR